MILQYYLQKLDLYLSGLEPKLKAKIQKQLAILAKVKNWQLTTKFRDFVLDNAENLTWHEVCPQVANYLAQKMAKQYDAEYKIVDDSYGIYSVQIIKNGQVIKNCSITRKQIEDELVLEYTDIGSRLSSEPNDVSTLTLITIEMVENGNNTSSLEVKTIESEKYTSSIERYNGSCDKECNYIFKWESSTVTSAQLEHLVKTTGIGKSNEHEIRTKKVCYLTQNGKVVEIRDELDVSYLESKQCKEKHIYYCLYEDGKYSVSRTYRNGQCGKTNVYDGNLDHNQSLMDVKSGEIKLNK